MKKWSRALDKLTKDVTKALNVNSNSSFAGEGRKLGSGDQPKPTPSNPDPSTSQSKGASSSRAAQAAPSPYETILRTIDDEAAAAAVGTMLARVDAGGKQQREETQESMRILRKVLSNVVADPDNEKVRTLRLANGKIARFVVDPPGAQALLVACGFVVQTDNSGDAMLVIPSDVAREQAGLMRRVVRVIETLLGIKAETTTWTRTTTAAAAATGVRGEREGRAGAAGVQASTDRQEGGAATVVVDGRPTALELPTAVENADLPPEFYQQSLAEVQQMYRHNQQRLEQSKVLMTKAQREKLRAGKSVATTSVVRVRVRAPDGAKIVGDFERSESLQLLFSWLAACLDERIVEFDLVTPERRPIGDWRFDAEKTIRDVLAGGSAGDVTLNLVIAGGRERGVGSGPIFKLGE